jgi:hypothetical protein
LTQLRCNKITLKSSYNNDKNNTGGKTYLPKPYIKKYDINDIINKFNNNKLVKLYMSYNNDKIERYIFEFNDNVKMVYYNDNSNLIDNILSKLDYKFKNIIISDYNNVMNNMYNSLYCEK